jgi:AraC family transcriptional regulator of adaptative response/methylated-DNA-[protein]-cysteine methyltransferase
VVAYVFGNAAELHETGRFGPRRRLNLAGNKQPSETVMLQEAVTVRRPMPTSAPGVRDYDQIRRAIAFLARTWTEQPGLEELAAHLDLEPTQCQKLFKRWCGLSPKEFVQALTVHHARGLLKDSASVLDAAFEVGLSGGGRLHDLFVSHEAMTPGEYKRRGEGLEMAYGFHASPFGEALLIATRRGLAGLAFVDEDKGQTPQDTLAEMMLRWPRAQFVAAPDRTASFARLVFNPADWSKDRPVRLVMIGSDFEVRVWETLLRIPMGRAVSYGDIASHLGRPTAARAVGAAVGRNPISFVVPCHRVLGRDGSLTGYHWGLTRKRALIGWEAGRVAEQG